MKIELGKIHKIHPLIFASMFNITIGFAFLLIIIFMNKINISSLVEFRG